MLELSSGGCAVEAQLNGMPVASLGSAGGRTSLAVHEYTVAGKNRLTLVIAPAPPGTNPPPQPRVAIGATWARVRLVLARQGQSPSDPSVRQLGALDWAISEGRSYDTPSQQVKELDLPLAFPRWRFLDAPPIAMNGGVQRSVLEFLQMLAVELGRGNPDPLIQASKLRFDELAAAYQSDSAQLVQRLRDHVQRLYAAKALTLPPPTADALVLRPLLEGRLIECLGANGGPALATRNEPAELGDHAWPLRIAMVEGKIYVLR